jgi:hypothetical protein
VRPRLHADPIAVELPVHAHSSPFLQGRPPEDRVIDPNLGNVLSSRTRNELEGGSEPLPSPETEVRIRTGKLHVHRSQGTEGEARHWWGARHRPL